MLNQVAHNGAHAQDYSQPENVHEITRTTDSESLLVPGYNCTSPDAPQEAVLSSSIVDAPEIKEFYNGAAAFRGIDFFPNNHKNKFTSTSYGSQIRLIDEGELLNQFQPRVLEILKKLNQTEPNGKMLTFCITVFDCEIKIIFLSDKKLIKETIDNYKNLNDSKRLLIIKYLEEITIFLFDKKKEIANEKIHSNGITEKIYATILRFQRSHQEVELVNQDAMELFSLMEGLLFEGKNISPIYYRVAISGFGDTTQFNRLSNVLDKLALPIPYASKQDAHSFSSATVAIDPTDISPDEDKLTVFKRFLTEAVSQIEKDIPGIEIKYNITLNGDQKKQLQNIKNLFFHTNFRKLLSDFNTNYEKSMVQEEFLLDFMFKYQHFDYTSYFAENLGATLYVAPTSVLPNGWPAENELGSYKRNFSLEAFSPSYHEEINKLAAECGVNFDSINMLYQLFSSLSGLAMAARGAHCAEDALLLYMREHPEEFTAQNSSTYIFSVQINKGKEHQDRVNIQSRCEVCQIHFDHDICHILNIPEEQVSTHFSTPHNMTSSFGLSEENMQLLSSTGVLAQFTTSLSGVTRVLSENHRYDGKHVISAAGDGEYSKLMNSVLRAYYFQKKHKDALLQAAARGRLKDVVSLLEIAKKDEKILVKLLKEVNDDGNTAMHYAAMTSIHENPKEMCEIVLLLLKVGGDPNIHNKHDQNVLSVFMEHLDETYQDEIFFRVQDILKEKCLGSKITERDFHHLKFLISGVMSELGNREALIHRGISDIILNDALQRGKKGERRAKDFYYAVKKNDILSRNIVMSELKHINTISDGNCAFSAVALGLLFYKNNGVDLFACNEEFREAFAEVFNIPSELLTVERLSCVIDAITSYDINLSNPIIISILKKLENITEVHEGSEHNQLNNRIMVLRGNVIDSCAYEEVSGQIKKEHRELAIFSLAYYGEIFQLAMSIVLRKLCAKHFSQLVLVDDGQGGVTQEKLETTNKCGEYVGTVELSFLAQYFNIKILEKQGEFGPWLTHNAQATHEISIFCIRPGDRDCHYELGLPRNNATQLLGGRLVMDHVNASFSNFFAVNLQKIFLKPDGPRLYDDKPGYR